MEYSNLCKSTIYFLLEGVPGNHKVTTEVSPFTLFCFYFVMVGTRQFTIELKY